MLTLDEAETLANRDKTERAAAIRRQVNWLRNFLDGWECAFSLSLNPLRDEVLAELGDYDRDRFLKIEQEGISA